MRWQKKNKKIFESEMEKKKKKREGEKRLRFPGERGEWKKSMSKL